MELLLQPTGWHWLVLGTALMALEVFAPGVFLLWLGLAAMATGGLVLVFPDLPSPYQLLGFTLSSLATILIVRHFLRRNPIGSEQPLLNRRGAQLVGRVTELISPIVNGYGKIKIGDSVWRVTGSEDCESGKLVKVTGVAGAVLVVELVRPLVEKAA